MTRKWPACWIFLWFGLAIVAQILWPTHGSPALSRSLHSPEWGHFLGFDSLGRDLQRVMLHASLLSAAFSALAVAIALGAGIAFGAGTALLPELPRFALLRALDFFLAFPALLLALAWAAIRGPGWGTLLGSLLIGCVPSTARLMHVRAREILAEPYVAASIGIGASQGRIFYYHLLPALRSILSVKVPHLFAQALMAEATLSFLGVGAPIGQASWGELLLIGKEYLFEAPHIAIAAGLPLIMTLLALQNLSRRESRSSS